MLSTNENLKSSYYSWKGEGVRADSSISDRANANKYDYGKRAKVQMRIRRCLTQQMSKSTMIAERGEGTMHDLRGLRAENLAELRGTSEDRTL